MSDTPNRLPVSELKLPGLNGATVSGTVTVTFALTADGTVWAGSTQNPTTSAKRTVVPGDMPIRRVLDKYSVQIAAWAKSKGYPFGNATVTGSFFSEEEEEPTAEPTPKRKR